MNGTNKVWDAVETFRRQYLVKVGGMLPVDVFSVVELELRLDVIPFDDLLAKYRIDAALTQDFTGIYVDAESYVFWEKDPVWKQNRLRFTVAHELGHWVLHRDYAANLKFASFDRAALQR
jgi:Zn-dependent peptidase ImmA (M78 family)